MSANIPKPNKRPPMPMIDTTNMDCEEYVDLLYDLRDGIVKYDDVIWRNQVSPIKNYLQRGDIVKVENNYFVVVSVNNDDGVLPIACKREDSYTGDIIYYVSYATFTTCD